MSQKIGFVGIGRMGANMARNLKDRGYEIAAVNDVDKEAAAELAGELGCSHTETLADVTACSDVIFTVVTNDEAMRSLQASHLWLLQCVQQYQIQRYPWSGSSLPLLRAAL